MTPPTSHDDRFSDGVHGDDGPLHNEDVAHEHSDVNVRAIVYFLVALSAVCLVAAAAMWGVFVVLDGQAAKSDPTLSPLATPAGELPPEPRLLTNEPANLEKQRAREREQLQSGGWVDRNAGIGRIPIDEAKKLLLQKGLPTRAGAPADPRLGTRTSSMSDANSGRSAVVPGTTERRKDGTPEGRRNPGLD